MDNLSEMISAFAFHLFSFFGTAENAFNFLLEVICLIERNWFLDGLSNLIAALGFISLSEPWHSLGKQATIEYVLIVLHLFAL